MNVQAQDQFHWWREAVRLGRGVDTEKGNVRCGYYRLRNEAIAFWRDDVGELRCWRSSDKYTPTKPDEIEDTFSFAAPHPVAYEIFLAFRESGHWPEDIAPIAAPDPELSPDQALTAEIDALRDQANGWIKEIASVKTQAEADRAANYAEAFAAFEKRAKETHEAEKRPYLEAGRKVDATWKPIAERAASLKAWAKGTITAFLIAEKKRIADEEAARKAEADRIEREARAAREAALKAGAPPPAESAPLPPIFAPPPQKAGAGTSGRKVALRKRTDVVVTDWRAFLTWLGSQNSHDDAFRMAVEKRAKVLIDAGFNPPGVETKEIEVAA